MMKAGFSRRNITPEKQMPMSGYDRRHGPSAGVLDPLYVSVLVLGNTAPELVLCSFDLLGTDWAFCTELEERIEKKLMIPRESVVVCATHTHSGPSGIFKNRGNYDREYAGFLLDRGLAAAGEALNDFADAGMFFIPLSVKGVAAPRDIGYGGAGGYEMKADMLLFKRRAGGILLCTFACHPTVLDEKNFLFSRDLPGAAASGMKEGERAIFLNGPCADISTRYTRRGSDVNELGRLGAVWGRGAEKAMERSGCEKMLKIETHSVHVCLPGRKGMDVKIQTEWMNSLNRQIDTCADEAEKREYLSRLAVFERGEYKAVNDREITMKLVDIGPLLLLFIPLEVHSSFGGRCCDTIREELGREVRIICYSGGYEGYLPSGRPLTADSCYEDLASPYSPDARSRIEEAIKKLIDEVHTK